MPEISHVKANLSKMVLVSFPFGFCNEGAGMKSHREGTSWFYKDPLCYEAKYCY